MKTRVAGIRVGLGAVVSTGIAVLCTPASAQVRQSSTPRPAQFRNVTCEALYRMREGIRPPAWRALSSTPLDQLSLEDMLALKKIVDDCTEANLHANLTIEQTMAKGQVQDAIAWWVRDTRKRTEDQRRAESQRAEAEGQAQAERQALSIVRDALKQLATAPPGAACNPSDTDIRSRVESQVGSAGFHRSIETSSEWSTLVNGCQARATRALTMQRREQERQQAAAITSRRESMIDYAHTARQNATAQLRSLGIPDETLNMRLVLQVDPITAAASNELDFGQLTLADWIGMIIVANPTATVTGAREPSSSDWGFAVKLPGSRTVTFYVRPDGGELFLSQGRIGDLLTPIASQEDTLAASGIVIQIAGILNDHTPP